MDPLDLSPILPGPISTDIAPPELDSRAAAASDFDSFLTLLTAQMRNQDPLSPLESTEFISQLASFSAVEQQITTNDRLEALTQQSLGGDIAVFANWIGTTASRADGMFRATGEEVEFNVPEVPGTELVRATVLNNEGVALARFDLDPNEGVDGLWDGLDASGAPLTGQNVRIELEFVASGTTLSTLPAEVPRLVTGLRGTANGVVLDLSDGSEATPDSIARIAVVPDAN